MPTFLLNSEVYNKIVQTAQEADVPPKGGILLGQLPLGGGIFKKVYKKKDDEEIFLVPYTGFPTGEA